jgi:phosphoribosylamine--glycine ligase
MMRLDQDLLELLLAVAEGRLDETEIRMRGDAALTIVMAAKGYPGKPETGGAIGLPDRAREGVRIFQAGTAMAGGRLVASGGRVLNVTACGATVAEARDRAYEEAERVDFPTGFYRRDIGWREIARQS